MLEYWMALAVVHSLAIAPRKLAEPLARFYTHLLVARRTQAPPTGNR